MEIVGRSHISPPAAISAQAVSLNGELLAVVYGENEIVIHQVKDGTSRDITLPDQSSRIFNP